MCMRTICVTLIPLLFWRCCIVWDTKWRKYWDRKRNFCRLSVEIWCFGIYLIFLIWRWKSCRLRLIWKKHTRGSLLTIGFALTSTIMLVHSRPQQITTPNIWTRNDWKNSWHGTKKRSRAEQSDFQQELSAYLKSDVKVLAGSLAAFSEEMVELTGIDPVTECVMIVSTAFKVWQKMFLKPNLIAREPHNGWRKNQVNQSIEAIEWLEFENFKRRQNSGKSTIKKIKLLCFTAC